MIGFNVSQLLKAPTGTTRHLEIEDFDADLARDLGLVSPVKGSLRLMRTPAGILVTGVLTQQIEATCARCLDTFVREQLLEIDEEFLPSVDVTTGVPLEDPGDPDAFHLTDQHILDLSEPIRQYAILEGPLSPLCRPDCKGLCAVCGANLNLGPCGHEQPSGAAEGGTFGELLREKLRRAGFEPREE